MKPVNHLNQPFVPIQKKRKMKKIAFTTVDENFIQHFL